MCRPKKDYVKLFLFTVKFIILNVCRSVKGISLSIRKNNLRRAAKAGELLFI